MIKFTTEQKKFAAYLLKKYNLSWEKYIKRFEGTTPLILRLLDSYPLKFEPQKVESEIDPIGIISSPLVLKKLEKNYKFVAGFKGKVTKDEIELLDYIDPNFAGFRMLFHKRVIDIMQKICPNDFEPIPITLISLNKQIKPFEINSFYAINVLKCVDVFDNNRHSSNLKDILNSRMIINQYFKNDPWNTGIKLFRDSNNKLDYQVYDLEQPCKIAIEIPGCRIIWHPELAKELPTSSLAGFFFDTEVTY